MYKIAVLGEIESVIGFSALGLSVFPVEDQSYAIIYVTETWYDCLHEQIEKHKDSVTPAVILIPGSGGTLGLGQSALDAAVERAVGANII